MFVDLIVFAGIIRS